MNINMKQLVSLALMTCFAISGCESDSVAPHDDPPALSERDTASQAALVVMAATVMGPVIVDGGITKRDANEAIVFDNPDGIMGTAYLDYFLGGPNGVPSTSEAADYAHLYTMQNMPLMLELGLGGGVSMGFDLTGDIDQTDSSAVISGTGTFKTGPNEASFAINEVSLETTSDYPTNGTVVFANLFYEITAYCDGTNTAIMVITGGSSYSLNLDDGGVEMLTEGN